MTLADPKPALLARLRIRLALLLALCAAGLAAGCGTPWATVRTAAGDDLMLLGYDPVAYFTLGRPTRGDPAHVARLPGRAYYFANAEHLSLFERDPGRYEPQYGGFCSNGAPFAIKLGSDPTEFEIRDGRLFIFGDVIGHTFWLLDPEFNIEKADLMWPAIRDTGWRRATLAGWVERVPWYRTHASLLAEFREKHPGRSLDYDPGGLLRNLLLEEPGWRARKGFGQPRLGVVGEHDDPRRSAE